MKVIYNGLIPFRGFTAINLFGRVFARKEFEPVSDRILRHEAIHTAQMRETGYVGFYLLYLAEWLWRWARLKDATAAFDSSVRLTAIRTNWTTSPIADPFPG